jgi:hypothetical protein
MHSGRGGIKQTFSGANKKCLIIIQPIFDIFNSSPDWNHKLFMNIMREMKYPFFINWENNTRFISGMVVVQ